MTKTITLLLAVFTLIGTSNAQTLVQKGIDINGDTTGDLSGYSVSMPDKNTVAIGSLFNRTNGLDAGHVRIFRWYPANGGAWLQKGDDINGEAARDYSGCSVSMPDSSTVAIGAYGNDATGSLAGHVRIYRWNGSAWVQKGIDIDGEAANDNSGYSVSMPDSNTVAIGAIANTGNGLDAGHVRIYRWNGSAWVQKGIDIDGETSGDQSGHSVSMPDSNTVAIGALYNGLNAGHVRIYRWNGSTWMQKGIDIDGEYPNDQSGYSVSMPDSNTVAIGAPNNSVNGNDEGHVRIYRWNPANGGAWEQKGIDIDGEAIGDKLGFAVSMPDSNTVAIGAKDNDGNGTDAGHVRIYHWSGNAWVQKGMDVDGEASGDNSGYSVSMGDSNTVAIGAILNIDAGNFSGQTRVYSFCAPIATAFTVAACNSYTWPLNSTTYTSSTNTPSVTYINAAGCDSVVTLNLTISFPNTGIDTQTACNSFTWIDGNTYTASNNTAIDTLTNVGGCDSIVTLNLTINIVNTGVTNSSPTLNANASNATYQWLDCNNNFAAISGETNQTFNATLNGNYAVAVTQNGCTDTSACAAVTGIGIFENGFGNALSIYPNPTTGNLSIDLGTVYEASTISITDISGRLIDSKNNTQAQIVTLSIEEPAGVYIISIQADDKKAVIRLIKE
ncbi:MAG: T9SS type A sorting domain-containing protein [Bacteroidota bacterium]|jgi:hypothetical protein